MKKRLVKLVSNYKTFVLIYLLAAVIVSFQSYLLPPKTYGDDPNQYDCYNNYTIFKQSFFHLINNQDLYQLYPEEHWDYYKYSPTFALLFGPLAILPDLIGLNIWNLLNAFIFLIAIYYLPNLTPTQKGWILLLCLIDLTGSMQNEQSNAMISGMVILAFGFLERYRYIPATLFIVLSVFIKLFGIVAFALFIFYPGRLKLIFYSLAWGVALFMLPLLIIEPDQLMFLYNSWWGLLQDDHSASYGLSVMGWLYTWFGMEFEKISVIIAGVILFLVPLFGFRLYKEYHFRLLTLVSILLWVVIFNHKAESPTFIIAMAGIAIWFMISGKNWLDIGLLVLAILFVSLSPTDIFPPVIRKTYVIPYVLKALPAILIWVKVIFEMSRMAYFERSPDQIK